MNEDKINEMLISYSYLIFKIIKEFDFIRYDDFIDIGLISLNRAINTYSDKYNTSFKTYAYRCIKNGIITELRNLKRIKEDLKLDETVDEGSNLTFLDTVKGPYEPESYIITRTVTKSLYMAINTLKDAEKFIIIHYYGINCDSLNDPQIGHILGCDQSHVCRLRAKALLKLKNRLLKEKIIDKRAELSEEEKAEYIKFLIDKYGISKDRFRTICNTSESTVKRLLKKYGD